MSDNRIIEFHKGTNKEKADPKFGIQVARSISQNIDTGYQGYFTRRNKRWAESRRIAAGEQNMQAYLDLMNIDGAQSFANLDLTPPAIAPKFMDIIVQRFMERDEHAKATAVDPASVNRKEYAKKEAQYRMENKDLIAGVTEMAGVPVEDPDAYVPDDKDDLEFYYGYENQLPEEIKFEKGIDYVMTDNDWNPTCKRKVIEDLAEVAFAATRTFVDVNGVIRARVCKPENVFYSWDDQYNDLRNISYCGELYKMKIPEYRARFAKDYIKMYGPVEAEKMIFEDIKQAAVGCSGYDDLLSWNTDWYTAQYRPYDDWEVEVMDFEFKTVDNDIFVAKTNSYGKL